MKTQLNFYQKQRVAVQIGSLKKMQVVLANSPWTRLRGWYSYRRASLDGAGIDAVLLTETRSVHTLGMAFSLDLIWLDSDLRCIQVALKVAPWRVRCCHKAAHVLECVSADSHPYQQDPTRLLGHQLKQINVNATAAGKEA